MPRCLIAAVDMDGTLLDTHQQISPANADAIARVTSAGAVVAIATGRTYNQIAPYLDRIREVGISHLITTNGTMIYDLGTDAVLATHSLEPRQIRAVVDACAPEDVMHDIASLGRFVVSEDQCSHIADWGLAPYQELFAARATKVPDAGAWALQTTDPVQKLSVHLATPEACARAKARIQDLDVEVADSETTSFEVSPQGVSKGTALLRLADLLGIDRKATLAVGDSGNDLTMIRLAGVGVAMGNATPDVMPEADWVTSDNAHDGCGEALLRFLL